MDVKVSWNGGLSEMAFEAVGPSGKMIVMDSSTEHGGKGQGPTPMEVLLFAVGGCTGMDVLSILRKKRQEVESLVILIKGTCAMDFPRYYTNVEIKYIIKGKNIKPEAVKRAIELSQTAYCGASQSLVKNVEVTHSFEIKE